MIVDPDQAGGGSAAGFSAPQRRRSPAPRRAGSSAGGRPGPSTSRAPPAARSSSSARPGPVGVRTQHAAGPSTTVASDSGGQAPRDRGQVLLGAGERREPPRKRPARRPRRGADVGLRGGGSRTSSAASSRRRRRRTSSTLGLRLGVALDRVGGELVDVGEDRLGQQAQRLGVEARPRGPARGDPPPGDPGADPVGGLQRVQRAPLAQLAAAELDVDLAARPAAGLGIADQGDELAQRLADAAADAAAEASLQRPRVLRDLAGDRGEDLRGDRLELGLDQVGDLDGKAAPGLDSRDFVI